ncbi:MAG: hypothetical protein RLY20_632, partial [Verrucomicrobiota bacterium]
HKPSPTQVESRRTVIRRAAERSTLGRADRLFFWFALSQWRLSSRRCHQEPIFAKFCAVRIEWVRLESRLGEITPEFIGEVEGSKIHVEVYKTGANAILAIDPRRRRRWFRRLFVGWLLVHTSGAESTTAVSNKTSNTRAQNQVARAATFLNTLQTMLKMKKLTSVDSGCAVSSVVEHYLDTVGVAGSNPASRTIFIVAHSPARK